MDERRDGMQGRSEGGSSEGGRYEIRLAGHLDARWAARFEGLALRHETDGTTVLSGPIVDQAALHGLLQRARDLGIPLVSVLPELDRSDALGQEPGPAHKTRRSIR